MTQFDSDQFDPKNSTNSSAEASSNPYLDAMRARQAAGPAPVDSVGSSQTAQIPRSAQAASQSPSQDTSQRSAAPVPPTGAQGAAHDGVTHKGAKHGKGPHGNKNNPSDPNKKHSKGRVAGIVAGSLLAGALGGAALLGVLDVTGVIGTSATGSSDGQSASQNITIKTAEEESGVAQAVAKKASPSVVSVYVTTADGSGVGSGVILDTDGNILTNYHVIANAQSISVSLSDGSSFEASVVGSDQSSDLAVIKADLGGKTVTPIEVGDSDKLEVGDWVMSIGSPYGLDQSVSTGIVSSLYRSTTMQSTSGTTIYANLIQTDAAINPGNSGGALVNDEGKLVGINSLIESASGSSAGIGFAIPANYAIKIANTIISGKTVTHAYIGVSVQTVTAHNARLAGLSVNQGAYVLQVTDGSPAAEAGLQKGDVITKIDDEDITSADALILAIRAHETGDSVKVTYVRDGKEQTAQVTLGSDEALQQSQNEDSSNSLGGLGNGFGGLGGNLGSDNSSDSSEGTSPFSYNPGGYSTSTTDGEDATTVAAAVQGVTNEVLSC